MESLSILEKQKPLTTVRITKKMHQWLLIGGDFCVENLTGEGGI